MTEGWDGRTHSDYRHPSPSMAKALELHIESGASPFDDDADSAMGSTDCEFGCVVEPDGLCPHGYESAAVTLGIM